MFEFFGKILIWKSYHSLKDQENSIKAFKKDFQLPKVKSPQEKKEMKYTLAFHTEGKNVRNNHEKRTMILNDLNGMSSGMLLKVN